jgi:hypothetical protein
MQLIAPIQLNRIIPGCRAVDLCQLNLYTKLNVKNTALLIRYALDNGIIEGGNLK